MSFITAIVPGVVTFCVQESQKLLPEIKAALETQVEKLAEINGGCGKEGKSWKEGFEEIEACTEAKWLAHAEEGLPRGYFDGIKARTKKKMDEAKRCKDLFFARHKL